MKNVYSSDVWYTYMSGSRKTTYVFEAESISRAEAMASRKFIKDHMPDAEIVSIRTSVLCVR